MLTAPDKITVNDFEYKVKLELKKKKNSSAKVYGDTVILRVSNNIPKKKQSEHVHFLLDSITKKLARRTVKPLPVMLDISKGFTLAGKSYKTKFEYQLRKSAKLEFEDDNTLKFTLPENIDHERLKEPVKKMLLKALADDNLKFLNDFVNAANKKYFNHPVNTISFKYYKSKWGECTSRKDISINTILLFCPLEILHYIVIHELAHIGMLNHSSKYWQKVESILPNRKDYELWLKNNGANVLNIELCWNEV